MCYNKNMKIYKEARRQKQANTIKGKGNPNWKGGQITKLCVRCDSPFLVYPSGNHRTHCSLTCANRDMADEQRGVSNLMKGRSGIANALYRNGFMERGSSNRNWVGDEGLTRRNALIRGSIEFKEWRQSVFTRDDYTCQSCGQRGGDLESHHINPFAKYPKLRFETSNGITLCRACHKLTF